MLARVPERATCVCARHATVAGPGVIPSALAVASNRRGACYAAAIAPDGASAVCLGRNVVLWDTARTQRLASAHPLSHPSHVAFAPSGREIAVKNTSGECAVLDATSLEVVGRLGGTEFGEGSPLAFTDDGTLIDGSWTGWLLARDVTTGEVLFREGLRRMITELTSSPDRRVFVYSEALRGADGYDAPVVRMRRWPFSAHEPVTLCESRSRVGALAVEGDLLAAVIDDELQIRSLIGGEVIARREVLPSGGRAVVWWPDTDRLLVADDGRFMLLDGSLEELWALDAEYSCDVAVSSDGTRALLACWDQSFMVKPV